MRVSIARHRALVSRIALVGMTSVFAAAAATAQTAAPADQTADQQGAVEEIVVTSHISRTKLETTVPVISLTTAQIQAAGITNLADLLSQLPQSGSPGFSNVDTNFSDDGAGISTFNLRNLGQNRTLVLIDGRRTVSGVGVGQGSQAVDISTIPTYLIDHIDINTTGGAGAAYGSEAVAGIVNIVLRDHYEGVMVNEQYGLSSTYGDSKTETFDLLAGTSFAGDKGHIVFGLQFNDQGQVLSKDRPFAAHDTSIGNVYGPSSYVLNGNFGTDNGLYTTLPNGQSVPYNKNLYGFDRNQVRTIQIPTQDLDLYTKASYDITDDITFFADGRYARDLASSQLEPIAIGAGSTTIGFAGQTLELPLNNPFIPASLAAQGIADQDDGNGGFSDWRRRFAELGDRGVTDTRVNFAYIFGFKGTVFDNFKWNAAYSYSEMDNLQIGQSGNVVKLQQELDATTINGQIVCSDPAARAAGCVPINLFGAGSASAAAIKYIKDQKVYTDQNKENDLNIDINGPVYSLPYGDIRLAAGFEYRTEDGYNRPDPVSAAGDDLDTSQPASGGGYSVKDYWIEGLIPVLKDVPFAKSLSIDGSFRYSDYSNVNVGGKQSYKYGISYSPVQDVTFRADNSVAIRAPDLTDLYQGRGNSATSVNDPCAALGLAGAPNPAKRLAYCLSIPGLAARINAPGGFVESINNQQSELSYVQGNADLTNERAEVFTYGVTFQPHWVPGFTASVDAFKYKIANAVQSIDIQTEADQCADTGQSNFCNTVRRFTSGPNIGLIQGVDQEPINVGSQDERGIDVALNYSVPVDDVATFLTGNSWGDGRVLIAWNYTFLQQYEYTAINGATTNQRGDFGAPKNRWNFTLGYTSDLFDVNWMLRYLGSQKYDVNQDGTPSFQPYIYNDVSIRYHLTDSITPYIGVRNLFDVQPPLVVQQYQQTGAGNAQAQSGTNTVPDVYDAIGRYVYFGVKFEMPFSAPSEEAAAYVPPPVVAPTPAPAVAHSYMVFFDFNKSDLTAQAVAIVDQAAKNATPAKATELTVTGHTDTVGSDAYNMRLSRRRAESVAAELEKMGIKSSEIEIVAKGKHDLLVPTKDGVREPQNRRVTIVYAGGAMS